MFLSVDRTINPSATRLGSPRDASKQRQITDVDSASDEINCGIGNCHLSTARTTDVAGRLYQHTIT